MRFKLDNSTIGECFVFAIEVTKKTKDYYSLRNKYARTEKLIMDMHIGKLAELAVWSHLVDEEKDCTKPNLKVKDCADDGDIKVFSEDETKIIHVKCVRHDSPVTDSWLIETNELQHLGDNDYFALCKYYEPDEIEIVRYIAANKIKWQSPKANLPTKSACYLSDLEIDT
jgi:hypothetical protein